MYLISRLPTLFSQLKAQEKELKTNFMKMIDVLKEEINKSL